MIKALVEYIGKSGRTIVKGFTDLEQAKAFCEKLSARNAGFLLTEI